MVVNALTEKLGAPLKFTESASSAYTYEFKYIWNTTDGSIIEFKGKITTSSTYKALPGTKPYFKKSGNGVITASSKKLLNSKITYPKPTMDGIKNKNIPM